VWALRTHEVVQTTQSSAGHRNLRWGTGHRVGGGALQRSAAPAAPPTLYLNPLPGDPYAATLRAAPVARPPLGAHAALVIPIGSTGILVGAALDDDPNLGRVATTW
jgi:hypothetical protein